MKSRTYEQMMDAEKARQLALGYSGLTINTRHPQIANGKALEQTMHEVVISIEGDDGNVYTGFVTRFAEEGKSLQEGQNKVRLGFRFGDNQPTKALDDKVTKYGFVAKVQ